jgi:hypothetical protein
VPLGSWLDLVADSRGNRLVEYRATKTRDGVLYFVEANCCSDVGRHVEMALEGLDPRRLDPAGTKWTHRFEYKGPYTTTLHESLELLKSVLTLHRQEELDGAFALDFYKVPEDGVPPEQWSNTEAGGLVNRGKYSGDTVAGRVLADQIATTIGSHRAYTSCEAVICIPGTNHQFGERLARGVARRLDIPCVQSSRQFAPAQAAKQGHEDTLLKPYEVDPDFVAGRRVVIVDDVYRTGISMRSVALAARAAGAVGVFGVVGARTLRN